MPSSRRIRIRPGVASPAQAEDAAAEGVRKACRELGSHLEAFEKFRAEAETLATAMELVADKIGLLASPGTGPVARALDEHPGAQERLVFRLARRLESFREDGRALQSRFERQTLPALKKNCAALRLWVHRREVQYWDLRAGHAVRAIFGPHICGDALDVSADGTQLLTGSCRDENQLELWDIAKGERIKVLPWRARGMEEPACFLYTARFSKDAHSSLICAGGSFASAEDGGEAKVFHYGGAAPHAPNKCLGTVVHYTCLSADFGAPDTGLLAMGGTDGRVRIMSLKPDSASKPSTATAGYRSQHSDLTSGSEVLGGS